MRAQAGRGAPLDASSRDQRWRIKALEDPCRFALESPSKQTRTKVLLASEAAARAPGCKCDARIDVAAAAVEMFHLATLAHDDVLDESMIRRGVSSLPARYGAPTAAMAGGLFFGRALKLFVCCGDEAVALAVETAQSICAGEMLQLRDRFDVDRTAERCVEAIEGKTAGMFRLAAAIGALLVKASDDVRDALGAYGLAVGVGYQIIDDIYGIVGGPGDDAEPIGNDLAIGNYTLPAIYAIEEQPAVRTAIQEGASVEVVVDLIVHTEAISRALAAARCWIGKAIREVRDLPRSDGLLAIAQAELARLNEVST
jgi:octaprenyl-diphosphate synthase